MTRVGFYLLTSQDPQQRQHFACRIADKAYQQGHQVMIHTESAEQSAEVDSILWTFRAESFVPHQILERDKLPDAPVVISHDTTPPPKLMDVLINLNPVQPTFFSQFHRLVEIIDENAHIKQQGRGRYQFYKDCGYPLEMHKIED